MKPHGDERVSLDGLTPEEALRALLAVKPDQGDGDREDDDPRFTRPNDPQ